MVVMRVDRCSRWSITRHFIPEFSAKDRMLLAEVKVNYAEMKAMENVVVMGVFGLAGHVKMNDQVVE
jgi:hypothetical protein